MAGTPGPGVGPEPPRYAPPSTSGGVMTAIAVTDVRLSDRIAA